MIGQILLPKWLALIILILLTGEISGQWLSGYAYREKIYINSDHVYGSLDLVDFPLLISMSELELRSVNYGGYVFNSNAWDIRFTSDDGITLLNHEIEFFDAVNGELAAWVGIPNLTQDEDTELYMYFGNQSVILDPSTSDTWNSEYSGVWHMSGNTNDASQYGNHGIDNGTSASRGKIGGSRYFDGTNDYVSVPNSASLNFTQHVTIEGWVKPALGDPGHTWAILIKSSDYGMNYIGDNDLRFFAGEHSLQTAYTLNLDQWYYLTETYDGSMQRIYVNGTEVDFVANTTAISNDASRDVGIGEFIGTSSTRFTGDIDELRLISSPRSPGWIRTSFENQDDPGNFYETSGIEISNDLPCDALLLDINEECSSQVYDNSVAEGSGVPLTKCEGYSGGDVWFTVEVPVSGNLLVEVESSTSPGWLRQPGLAVYSGTCDNLTHDTCWIDAIFQAPHLTPEFILSTYTPGEILFLRVWGYNGSTGMFRICASDFVDSENPTIICPENISVPANQEDCSSTISIAIPVTDDNFGVASLVNDFNGSDDASDSYPLGTSLIEWTVTDLSGNTATCSHSVVVSDTSSPLITCLSDQLVNMDANCEFMIPDYTTLISLDENCDPAPSLTQFPAMGTVLSASGTVHEIILTARDEAENESTCLFNITLLDEIPPESISISDTSVTVQEGIFETYIEIPLPIFNDNCGVESIKNDFNGGTDASGIYQYGTTRVVYTVTDINTNTASFIQQVLVEPENGHEHGLVIPEVFSPNEDGFNDRFEILGLEQYPENDLYIYNVNGIEVFHMKAYDNSWDGTSMRALNGGNKLPTGTYYYVLHLIPGDSFVKGFIYIRRE